MVVDILKHLTLINFEISHGLYSIEIHSMVSETALQNRQSLHPTYFLVIRSYTPRKTLKTSDQLPIYMTIIRTNGFDLCGFTIP